MPIRINLLAEAQAAEEMRRKDPVKRAIWIGGFFVCIVLLWILKLQFDIFFEQKDFQTKADRWESIKSKYGAVTNNMIQIGQIDQKLAALDRLTTNRFLWAPVMNALQKTMVDNVQVTSLRSEQLYSKEPDHDVGSGSSHVHIPGAVVEKISLYIDGKDDNPEAQDYNKFKESLCNSDFFVKALGRSDGFILDGTLSTPAADPADPSKQFVNFSLASHFPEHRNE